MKNIKEKLLESLITYKGAFEVLDQLVNEHEILKEYKNKTMNRYFEKRLQTLNRHYSLEVDKKFNRYSIDYWENITYKDSPLVVSFNINVPLDNGKFNYEIFLENLLDIHERFENTYRKRKKEYENIESVLNDYKALKNRILDFKNEHSDIIYLFDDIRTIY